MFFKYKDKEPKKIGDNIFVAEGAKVIGDVTLNSGSNIWFNAVLRGDDDSITIGNNTNIQDNCTVHCSKGTPTVIGNYVTVGHNAVVHGCTVEDNCLIGMGATILDGAVIGEGSIVGANALVTGNTIIPPNSLVLGSPAKVVKEIQVCEDNIHHAKCYCDLAKDYL